MRAWLRDARKASKKTARDFAQELGLTENHYWLIEQGTRKKVLDLNLAVKIAEVTGMTIEEVVEHERGNS